MAGSGDTLPIRAAGLLVTYWCNARCAHCYELSGPDRKQWMSVADARRHLVALARTGVGAAGVHIGGGEPFGDYPLLLAIVRAAREAGLDGVGYVETNGFWATDVDRARARLEELREAGMRQISISADVYHQSFVDPACVVRLHEAAREVFGPRGVRARRWRFLKSPRDLRALGADERRDAYRAALAEYPERMTGRAARNLADLVPGRPAETFADERCREAVLESGHVHVDPGGHVFPGTCVGLVLGRASATAPLDEALAAPRGPVWRTLAESGPVGLMREAKASGYAERKDGYAHKCHLCTEVRGFLLGRGLFADELGPSEAYREL